MDSVHIELGYDFLHDVGNPLSDFRKSGIIDPDLVIFLHHRSGNLRIQSFVEIGRSRNPVWIYPGMEFNSSFVGFADEEIHDIITWFLPLRSGNGAAPRLV